MSDLHRQDIIRFLRALDARLSDYPGQHPIVLVGGAAIILRYATRRSTTDIDTIKAEEVVIQAGIKACKDLRLNENTFVKIGVYDAPYTYEDRIELTEIDGLRRLIVQLPERHDLAIMKISRAHARDLEAVADMHAQNPFDLPTLIARYNETSFSCAPNIAESQFLGTIEDLLGPRGLVEAKRLLLQPKAAIPI